jgi:hypothetical protein
MAVAPTGQRGKAKKNLKDLLAESTTFQTAIGATGTDPEKIAAAKLRIHITAYEPADYNFVKPYGLICSTGNDKNDSVGVKDYEPNGDLELRLIKDIPAEYKSDPASAETDFENFFEGVMADAEALSGQPGYFVINNWHIIEGPGQYEIEEGVFESGIRILINWGLQ